jgi:hypothetical protein
MAESRFDWYEQVRVESTEIAKDEINGKLGAILGKAQGEDGRWTYGVYIYDQGLVWSCTDEELSPTGKFDRRASFYDGTSIRVSERGELLE